MPIDRVDREILAELQKDGRQTITELSEKVRMSISRCQRRLRELERAGVIRGYKAVLDPEAMGLGFDPGQEAVVHPGCLRQATD